MHRFSFCIKSLNVSNTFYRTFIVSNQGLNSMKMQNEVPLISYDILVKNRLKKSDARVDPGSIYKTYPNAEKALIGKNPKLRYVWDEQDCSNSFPSTPEEARLDLLNFLEQRDMWMRRKNLKIPQFCVGSIIKVTRADRLAPEGWTRFVGICIHKNYKQNMKGANFTLRNVLFDEPLEIRYPFYSPLIQKIEVLRHEKWENELHWNGLKFLRDYPPAYSTIDENMEAEEYTTEPVIRRWTDEDKDRVASWFKDIYKSRKR
ncbi:large ribosomal subunit protein bL19m [Hydra vulgaris]|uniref:Large ribosomal subunit protein bL19m n=1 Tax=Hydra vulgaris TaxID=6087 RepID=T2MF23_HYDVU|nr:39S ribosomal protein L19, mitochondrial [Hydra vulgaris]